MPVKKNNKKTSEDKNKETTKKKKVSKKSTKKKVASKVSKKKIEKKVSKKAPKKEMLEIKQAVKDLPSVLFGEMQNNDSREETTVVVQREKIVPVKKEIASIYKSPRNSQKWLWSAVVIFTVVIFSLWILNVGNIFFESKNLSKGPLVSLVDSKEDLQKIFNSVDGNIATTSQKIGEAIENEIAKEEEKNNQNVESKLQEAMNSLFQSPSSTTSTIVTTEVTTSTTSTINN